MSSSIVGGPRTGNFNRSGEQVVSRRIVTKSWNTVNAQDSINGNNRVITPFRAVNNSGDYLARKNYTCGGPNPTSASKPGLKSRIGHILSSCDNSGVDGSSTNVKFVPDSSDYIKYKKLTSANKNYNDTSACGDEHNGSYTYLMRVRR